MTETQYALAWFRLRMLEAWRVPLPDHGWLKPKTQKQEQKGLFDEYGEITVRMK